MYLQTEVLWILTRTWNCLGSGHHSVQCMPPVPIRVGTPNQVFTVTSQLFLQTANNRTARSANVSTQRYVARVDRETGARPSLRNSTSFVFVVLIGK